MKMLFSLLVVYSLANSVVFTMAAKSDLDLLSSLISSDESFNESPSPYSYNPNIVTQYYQDDQNRLYNPYLGELFRLIAYFKGKG